jgi:hypothetical protein
MKTAIDFLGSLSNGLYENELRGSDLSNLFIEPIKNKYNEFRQELRAWRNAVLPWYKQRIIEMKNESFRRYPATTFITTFWLMCAPVGILSNILLGNPVTWGFTGYIIPVTIGAAVFTDMMQYL